MDIMRINSCSKFYLKVGGLLYQKGAEIGLKPDGLQNVALEELIINIARFI